MTVLPASVLAAPAQAVAEQGSRPETEAAEDVPAQGGSPDPAQASTPHVCALIANTAELKDAGSTAPPPRVLPQHPVAVAQPALDPPGAAPSPSLAAAPPLPSVAPLGAATAETHIAPPPSAAPSSTTHTPLPSPAAQITPALVHIAATPDGSQSVTVRLDPVELGELHIRIERPHEGPVQVTVEVTRPETLQLLRQDEPALHRALDQAGLPSDGRIVVLQQSGAESGGQRQGAEMGGGTSASGGGQGGSRGNSQGWSQRGSEQESASDRRSRPAGNWLRVGVNITA